MDLNEFLQLKAMEQQRVNFEMTYVDMTGDLISGLLLSQIIYWFTPDKNGKSKLKVTYKGKKALAKSRNEWFEEIRITEKQYDKAIKILQDLKIVEVVNSMFNSKRTPFIMLNDEEFLNLYRSNLINTTVLPKGKHRYSLKGKTDIDEKLIPLTEITADITTEITERYNTHDTIVTSVNNFYKTFDDLIKHINTEIDNLELNNNFNQDKNKMSEYFYKFYSTLYKRTGLKQKVLTNKQLQDSINYCLESIETGIFTDNRDCLFDDLLELYIKESQFKTLNGFFSKYILKVAPRVNKINCNETA